MLEIRGFGTKFYEPDDLPNVNRQKYTPGFIFAASVMMPEGITPFHVNSPIPVPQNMDGSIKISQCN